jgi:hypothetical protein
MTIQAERGVAECLAVIGWNNSVFSNRLNIGLRIALRWKNEQNVCPPEVLTWLNKLADEHERLPLPRNWHR